MKFLQLLSQFQRPSVQRSRSKRFSHLFSRTMVMIAMAIALPVGLPVGSATTVNAQEESAFLWTVESPTNTVYLLGSVHILRPTDYPLAQPIQEAFDDAEYVMFEVDFNELNSANTQRLLLEAALPEHPQDNFQAALSPETYQLAETAATEVGLSITLFDRFEPWFFSMLLPSVHLLKLGFNPLYGVDPYLFNAAQEAGKPVSALETVEEQISFFDDLSIDTQATLVEQTVLEVETIETSFNTLIDAWQAGDVDTFEPLILESFNAYPEVYDVLLRQRNQRWLSTVESLINQPNDFLVVVGAAHLVGPDSVVQLLRTNGYTVEQVGQDEL